MHRQPTTASLLAVCGNVPTSSRWQFITLESDRLKRTVDERLDVAGWSLPVLRGVMVPTEVW
jgi:hypothetical protein